MKMARHIISLCIFCFICATHTPCSSHVAVDHLQSRHHDLEDQPEARLSGDGASGAAEVSHLIKRDSDVAALGDDTPLKKIFALYGDGENMKMEGFERLMRNLLRVVPANGSRTDGGAARSGETHGTSYSNTSKQMCIDENGLIASLMQDSSQPPTKAPGNRTACLAQLYSIVAGDCVQEEARHRDHEEPYELASAEAASVWFYSNVAVLVISLCGILGLAVIPIMQKRYYQQLLQFLVALAVGTLSGDALLHLLPHAMGPGEEGHGSTFDHDENMWKGFTAMVGLMFFFVMERVILFVARWRKGRQFRQLENPRVKIIKQNGADASRTGEKQCVNKYSSFPLCYNDIINTPNSVKVYTDADMDNTVTTIADDLDGNPEPRKSLTGNHKLEANQNMTDCPNDITSICTEVNKMLSQDNEKENGEYTVILREHESRHHGHSHSHGHVHAAPKTMSSVAWMVIMGDGLHNFTDGMAIGAAFSGSIAGGFSTAVAVFCHELPHELGDFAMLLKAGMTMKQALFYNLLSSVLCIIGNAVGVVLGNTPYSSSWVFAMAAGMFIYIALVDMIPELSSAHEDEGNLLQFFLHLGGLTVGVFVMTLIALYEHDLKHIFRET